MAGTFQPGSTPRQPGLYINFVETAQEKISGGIRGTVAIPLKVSSGTAVLGKTYEVKNETEAAALFGAANIQSVKFALQAGAKSVLVYAMEVIDELAGPTKAEVYAKARLAFDARPFNVFAFDGEELEQHDETLAWVEAQRELGKHFFVVLGGDAAADLDVDGSNTRSVTNKHDYVINLITGVELGGVEFSSGQYSPYIAGLVAQIALNRSLTYFVIPVDDVTLRLTKTQVDEALNAGSLVLVNDGEKVKIVQGLATGGKKIKSIKTRQTIATDITKTGEDSYIGKINNNIDGQKALTSAIKAYLEELQASGVLTNIEVFIDETQDNSKENVFIGVGYDDVESVERILLSVNL